ncbi:hypothetical protein KP509_02G057300 [Ceratopteris richardii]|nr:hypothetical protein KP509_02G057300 [Ceratopteris richardii]
MEKFDLDVIRDVDLNKLEPWDIHERCRIDATQQAEWYFFSHKDKKYPTGTRTNRATAAGFWKATGRDKAVHSGYKRIGMRKTLVFYRGRAPHGQKTDWIMHEYRLEENTDLSGAGISYGSNEDGWVVCRVFKKRIHYTNSNQHSNKVRHDALATTFNYQQNVTSEEERSSLVSTPTTMDCFTQEDETLTTDISTTIKCKEEIDIFNDEYTHEQLAFLHLPPLESPRSDEPLVRQRVDDSDDGCHTLQQSSPNHLKFMKKPMRNFTSDCTASLSYIQEHSTPSTKPLIIANRSDFRSNSSSCTSMLNSAIFASGCTDVGDETFMLNTNTLTLADYICPSTSDHWSHILESLPKDLRLYHQSSANTNINVDQALVSMNPSNTVDCFDPANSSSPRNQTFQSVSQFTVSHSQALSDHLLAHNMPDTDIWSSFSR